MRDWFEKKVLAVAHIGDVDAISSFVAFADLVRKLVGKKTEFCVTGEINRDAQNIIDYFKLQLIPLRELNLSEYSVILLDTQPELLPDANWPELAILDHHRESEAAKKLARKIIDTDAVSTTELIYKLFLQYRLEPSRDAAIAIVFGIVADTAGLRYAKTKNFKMIFDLLSKYGIEYRQLFDQVTTLAGVEERIAWLKAASRLKIFRSGDKLLVLTNVGAFESAAAQKLLRLGADVVLVTSRKNGQVRIIGRARSGFDLATIFSDLARELGGSGGGHPCAAGLTIPQGKEKIALSKIKTRLGFAKFL